MLPWAVSAMETRNYLSFSSQLLACWPAGRGCLEQFVNDSASQARQSSSDYAALFVCLISLSAKETVK